MTKRVLPTRSGRARRPALVALAVAMVVGAPLPARAATTTASPGFLEPSQSCLVENVRITLTLWGSNIFGPHTITDLNGDISPTAVNGDAGGNFTALVTLTPTTPTPPPSSGGQRSDIFYVDFNQPNPLLVVPPPLAAREVRISSPGSPACPDNRPAPSPCVPAGTMALSTTGLYSPGGSPAGGYPGGADWYLDYPGAGHNPPSFDHTPVGGGQGTVTLPGSASTTRQASAGNRLTVTVVARDDGSQNDIYVTFVVNVCSPVATTTPTTASSTTPPAATTTPTTAKPIPGGTTTSTSTPAPAGPTPALTVTPAVGPDGFVTMVHGSGFAPGAVVTLEWLPGIGTVTMTTGGDGTFNTGMLVLFHDQVGVRQVHARGFAAAVAAPFLVETGTAMPPSHGGSALLFRH